MPSRGVDSAEAVRERVLSLSSRAGNGEVGVGEEEERSSHREKFALWFSFTLIPVFDPSS
jgi:hypothetical protein